MPRRRHYLRNAFGSHLRRWSAGVVVALTLFGGRCSAQESVTAPLPETDLFSDIGESASLTFGESGTAGAYADLHVGDCEDCLAHAASSDMWNEELGLGWESPYWRPFDRLRQLGFRHSSTHGRNIGRGIPLEGTSWLNRPLHFDWFVGPLISDDLVTNEISQANDVLAGIRLGWDFDYFWGVEWRFAWADPNIHATFSSDTFSGRYFASDVDVLYYPWGDSLVRPYLLWGLGVAEVDSLKDDGSGLQATLLQMPFGAGLVFPQNPWLAWRLEFLDNLAFGNDGVSTMNNLTFTAGMELRLGGRPNLYWPWRPSRKVW